LIKASRNVTSANSIVPATRSIIVVRMEFQTQLFRTRLCNQYTKTKIIIMIIDLPNSNYINDLRNFVNKEQDTQNHQVLDLWSQSPAKRVSEGEAIRGITIRQQSYNQLLLSCSENISKFRVGDSLRLSRGNPEGEHYDCQLIEENGNELVVKSGFNVHFDKRVRGSGWVLDKNLIDIRFLQLGILDSIDYDPRLSNYFYEMLNGEVQISFIHHRETLGRQIAESKGLNDTQIEAFSKAYAAQNYYLIQGPPGTGKTLVLAYLAEALAREGQRVLITAFTHRAINNALVKIAKVTQYPKVIKIGQFENTDDLKFEGGGVSNYEYVNSSPYYLNNYGVIIGATCYALRTKRLRELSFDTVIFDEAGQMTIPLAFAGMMAGGKSIFIGDHQQMPPVILADHKPKWVSSSIFERLYQHSPGTMLNITYRMNRAINEFPSKAFYGGKLQINPQNENKKLNFNKPPSIFTAILNPEKPDVFVEVSHKDRGMRSPEEAEIAAQLVVEAVSCGIHPKEIAVIAPYRAQGRLIRQLIREYCGNSTTIPNDCVVDTVERIQGQEREMIIISLTTSDPAHASRRAEFFFQPNRLNVAITRPKVKRIVLGSPLLFKAQSEDKSVQQNIQLFVDFYNQSEKIRV